MLTRDGDYYFKAITGEGDDVRLVVPLRGQGPPAFGVDEELCYRFGGLPTDAESHAMMVAGACLPRNCLLPSPSESATCWACLLVCTLAGAAALAADGASPGAAGAAMAIAAGPAWVVVDAMSEAFGEVLPGEPDATLADIGSDHARIDANTTEAVLEGCRQGLRDAGRKTLGSLG